MEKMSEGTEGTPYLVDHPTNRFSSSKIANCWIVDFFQQAYSLNVNRSVGWSTSKSSYPTYPLSYGWIHRGTSVGFSYMDSMGPWDTRVQWSSKQEIAMWVSEQHRLGQMFNSYAAMSNEIWWIFKMWTKNRRDCNLQQHLDADFTNIRFDIGISLSTRTGIFW